jgi:hypothetical protein
MQLYTRNLLVLSTLMLSFACGGEDDEKSGGPVASGVAKDKQLSALTQAEAEQLGKSFAESMNVPELIRGMCTMGAVFASLLAPMDGAMPAQSCEQLVEQCVEGAASNPAMATAGNAPALPTAATGYMGCTVTVGELEGCLTASIKVMTEAFGSIQCGQDLSAMEGGGAVNASPASIAECKNLTTACPTVFADPAGSDVEFETTPTSSAP